MIHLVVPHIQRRLSVVLATLAALALGSVALTPVDREVLHTTAPHTPEDVERFGGSRVLGQAFIAPESGLAEVQLFPAAPIPENVFPILLHLRHGRYATTDIRTFVLGRNDVPSTGPLRVRFAPILQSSGRPYVIVLEAPNARSASIMLSRQIDGSIYDQGYLYAQDTNEIRPGDLEFTLGVRQPRVVAWWNTAVGPLVRNGVSGAQLLQTLLFGALIVAATIGISLWVGRHDTSSKRLAIVLAFLVLAHILLHLPYILSYPGVNDEGSYLMDIQNLRAGHLAFRDTLTKGPLFLAFLTPVALLSPHTLLPARVFLAGISGIEVLLLFFLGKRLAGQAAGFLAAALWALAPIAAAQTSHVFLQTLSLPFVTAALMLLVGPARGGMGRGDEQNLYGSWPIPRAPFWAGILLALAYLTRSSSLAFVPIAVLMACVQSAPLRAGMRRAFGVLLGFVFSLGIVAAILLPFLGPSRTAVLFNLEAILIGHARTGAGGAPSFILLPPREIYERFAAYGAVLFRTGLPVLILWVAFVTQRLLRLLRLPRLLSATLFLGALTPLLLRINAASFYLARGAEDPLTATFQLLSIGIIGLTALLLIGLRTPPLCTLRRTSMELILLGGAWVSLALLYAFFGRFRQPYHAEFIPLYTLGTALFLAEMLPLQPDAWKLFRSGHARVRTIGGCALATLCATYLLFTVGPARAQPHAGSIPQQTARAVGAILKENSGPREEILTAQGLFTFYADRFMPFGASHPGWYLEERVGTVPPELRRLFLPDKAVLRAYIENHPVRLVAIDRRTREVYFLYDPDMQALLERSFRLLTTVENPLEKKPVEIWIRK